MSRLTIPRTLTVWLIGWFTILSHKTAIDSAGVATGEAMPTIFFDYDGTLHDTMILYSPAFRLGYDSLVRAGWAKPREFTDEWISHWLGWTIPDMWHTFMPNLPDDVWKPAAHIVGAEMDRIMDAGEARLYEGVPEMLDELLDQGYDLAILSNSSQKYRTRHNACFGLDRWFSAYYVAQDFPGMEKWQYFQKVMGNHAGPYIVVGDRFHDIEAAVRAGVPSIGCAYGCGELSELDQATIVVQSPAEIPQAVGSLL